MADRSLSRNHLKGMQTELPEVLTRLVVYRNFENSFGAAQFCKNG
jgi:hypothetical protein